MQWNGLSTRLGFGVPETTPNTRAKYVDMHQERIDISPCKRDQFRPPQPRTPCQDNHRFDAKRQFVHQSREFYRGQYIWLPQALRRSPDLGDGAAVCPFMPDCMIKDCGHDVPNLALRCRSI